MNQSLYTNDFLFHLSYSKATSGALKSIHLVVFHPHLFLFSGRVVPLPQTNLRGASNLTSPSKIQSMQSLRSFPKYDQGFFSV